jgi:hypothetical protein
MISEYHILKEAKVCKIITILFFFLQISVLQVALLVARCAIAQIPIKWNHKDVIIVKSKLDLRLFGVLPGSIIGFINSDIQFAVQNAFPYISTPTSEDFVSEMFRFSLDNFKGIVILTLASCRIVTQCLQLKF